MSLKQKLIDDMKVAMKAKDMARLTTIRTLRSEIKNVEIDHGEQNDAGVQKIVAKTVKQWKEGLEAYRKADRADLVSETEAKIAVLKKYLPQQMSDDDLRKIISDLVAANPDLAAGPLTGKAMAQVKGQADGARVAKMVQSLLN